MVPADHAPKPQGPLKEFGFWGGIWVFLGATWDFCNKIPKNPNTPQEIPSHSKTLGFFGIVPSHPKKNPKFWGQLGFLGRSQKIGVIPRKLGWLGIFLGWKNGFGAVTRNSRKNIYIRHRDCRNVRMYCKCVWLEHEVEVSRTCAEKHRIYQNIRANVQNPPPKKKNWDPKKIPRKSQKIPIFLGIPIKSQDPKLGTWDFLESKITQKI